MEGYLGEFSVKLKETPFAKYKPKDWALWFIQQYGGIGGLHHKAWVMDQVARILNGTPVIVKERRWDNGYSEFQVSTGQPSPEYREWVKQVRNWNPTTETYDYGYDEGIAP